MNVESPNDLEGCTCANSDVLKLNRLTLHKRVFCQMGLFL